MKLNQQHRNLKNVLDETGVEQLINYSDNDLIINKSKTEETVSKFTNF